MTFLLKEALNKDVCYLCRQGLEYGDYIPCWKIRPSLKKMECPENDTKLHLKMRLQFWISGECAVLFIAITPRSILRGSTF